MDIHVEARWRDGDMQGGDGATSVHVTKHLYGVRLRDLVYMTSIYMK